MAQFSIRLTEEDEQLLEELAKQQCNTKAGVIRVALRYFKKHYTESEKQLIRFDRSHLPNPKDFYDIMIPSKPVQSSPHTLVETIESRIKKNIVHKIFKP